MKLIKTDLPGLLIVEPQVFEDSRGYFFESFQSARYRDLGITADFIQDNESKSEWGVVRGLHYQLEPYAQSKLVRVVFGKVFDVAVDLRDGSPTFGKWFGIELSAENKKQFYIPKGFAHGFSVLSQTAILAYKCDKYYSKESERGIRFDDSQLNIGWQVPAEKMIFSEKDRNAPYFKDAETNFKFLG